MSEQITIELTDAEYKALAYVAYDPREWVENFTKNRCRKAMDEIVNEQVQQALNSGGTVSGTKEEIVLNANISSAKELTDAEDAETSLP